MAYMNLLYRIQAAIVDSETESRNAVAKADEWVGKALDTKRAKAHAPTNTAAPLGVDGPAPGPGDGRPSLPPPPPPPPPVSVGMMNRPATDLSLPRPPNRAETSGVFWQVSGGKVTGGDVSARALLDALKAKGVQNVRIAIGSDQLVRLFVGPFSDQGSADDAKAALEAAGFHVVRQW